MGRVSHSARVSGQYGTKAAIGVEWWRIDSEGLEGLSDSGEQASLDALRFAVGQGA